MSYCTIEDLRKEGITEDQLSDVELDWLINFSSGYIDGFTHQWFELRAKSIRLDGRGVKNLELPAFLYEAYSVSVDGKEIDDYVLYNRMEDRNYPKIFRAKRWPKGNLNVKISGLWGYVEEDGSTPADIKRAAMKLALYHFPSLSDKEAQEEKNLRGLLVSETTDGHSYSLNGNAVTSSLTGDLEIDRVMMRYSRSKIRMAIV